MRSVLPFAASLALFASPAFAEAPRVVVDTAPLHSLVARVMQGAGAAPDLLLPPGGSPHDSALRPSDARRLSQADLVVWTGPALLPWMAEALPALAPDAETLALLEQDGWAKLPLRDEADFEGASDHDHGHSHKHEHEEGEAAIDPHAWLDPEVAADWMRGIAATLAGIDPENAALYEDNAAEAIARDAEMTERLAAQLAPLSGRPYLVPHDAYQYFERRFDLPAAGALALSDAAAPGPARIAELRDKVAREGIACVLTDPETPPDLVALLREGTQAATAETDPDALRLTPGPDLYPALIEGLAEAIEGCLG